MADPIGIAEETPLQDDVRALVAELNVATAEMEPETPDEFNFPLTVEQMAEPGMTVWVARRDGAAIGCCALRAHADGVGEIKRMYVRPAGRGLGLGERLLAAAETRAAALGLTRLALETGHEFRAARRVYEAHGFTPCPAFGDYRESPYTVFYEKALGRTETSKARP